MRDSTQTTNRVLPKAFESGLAPQSSAYGSCGCCGWRVSLLWPILFRDGTARELAGLFAVDGLTVVWWTTVTLFSAIVQRYSRRYMAGSQRIEAFFGRVFAFTLFVLVLAAADHLAVFVGAWLAMGLVIS